MGLSANVTRWSGGGNAMRARTICGSSLAAFLLSAAVDAQAVVAAEMVRGYFLIEVALDDPGATEGALSSLDNCKAVAENVWSSELIVHIQCNNLHDLNKAVIENMSKAPGVSRLTTLAIMKDR
jgi:hypothetical protein